MLLMAAAAGKHILCEKPMATSVRDAEAMIDACDRAGVRLAVMYQNRYHPAHIMARQYISEGRAGAIDYASAQLCRGRAWDQRGSWRTDPSVSGSGAIVAQAVHPIDLLRFLMDSEVESVSAMTDESAP